MVHLSAGDMIPADARIGTARDFFVNQANMTGESRPVEKMPAICAEPLDPVTDYINIAFLGSYAVSGSATAVVLSVGEQTLFGSMTEHAAASPTESSYTQGVNAISWVLIRFMCIMAPVVFFINGLTKGDLLSALLFSISVAVGLTPEMLPVIVTAGLVKGAAAMGKKQTIVRNLNAMQDLGAMDILCTDKTGTITQDNVALQYHTDLQGNEDSHVLQLAYINSYFQTGYQNLIDRAILQKATVPGSQDSIVAGISKKYNKIDEIPFDFRRRRLTIIVQPHDSGVIQTISKGAVEEILAVCSHAQWNGTVRPLTEALRQSVVRHAEELSKKGFRVLAVACKNQPASTEAVAGYTEDRMVLMGYLAFLDPPKESAASAIAALQSYGVTTKVLTGDNEAVAVTLCRQVGMAASPLLSGKEIDGMDDAQLRKAAAQTRIFAKLTPEQKRRVILALRGSGHTVGFLGDGMNDILAMKAADVGVSVDTAAGAVRHSADIILLEKDLTVLTDGILEGRRTYANLFKYIKITISSNFGNVFSVLAASALLPFLPMLSIQLIFLNLMYDISCIALPWDNVDNDMLKTPRTWNAASLGSFMVWFGPVSSLFDWATYLFMYFVCCPLIVSGGVLYADLVLYASGTDLIHMQSAYMALFQTGWFVESLWSQMLVLHMIRTAHTPFIQSRPSAALTVVTFAGITALPAVPFTPLGRVFGLVPLPSMYFFYLLPCVILYMLVATAVKKMYIHMYGELL